MGKQRLSQRERMRKNRTERERFAKRMEKQMENLANTTKSNEDE